MSSPPSGPDRNIPEKTPTNFASLRVAAFESRMAGEMEAMITRAGGLPRVSPSMREVPLDASRDTIDFAHRLLTGQVDVVVLMTGVGTRQLVEQVSRHVDRERFLAALADVTTIARGPKPVAVLKTFGLAPTYRAAEPNTWREVLSLVDERLPIANLNVAVQEYGQPNVSLIAGLEARGAKVECVRVYRWDLPEDTAALEANVREIAGGNVDVLLFTSSQQIHNLLEVARRLGLADAVREATRRMVVASIGPTTSETLRQLNLPVDLEPEHSKMGHLVQAAAERSGDLLARKKQVISVLETLHVEGMVIDTKAPWYESPFMKACRREPTPVTPIWLMRQAGRYMAEYREVRAKTTFLELCKNPALCAEVMITAVNRLGVDAAIIFSDLLPILEPMGMQLEFAANEGPVIHNPLREADDVDRLVELESVDALHFVMETVRQTRAGLSDKLPLIGFAGAPFTLASYAIEGGGSRNFLHTKTLMYRDEGAWSALMGRLSRAVARYLNAQIAAGAQAVQLFDSWVGCLGPDDYRRYVLPYVKAVIEAIVPGVPVINFATGNPALVPLLAEAGGAVIGLDWRVRLDEAWETIGPDRGVQGNLDPAVLLADRVEIRRRAKQILDQAAGRPGHIFNLGHGVLQQTPVDNAIALVDAVHELSRK
ncbi:MAG: uroporphyrinogen decarboxylase [Planctomycetota bacterium]|nr:MAG: uroporphyrinogen decarboxylase [Planctomycetota bacterium]